MRFEHRFRVNAPLAAVAEFHSRAASMPAITPPPMVVKVHSAPERLGEGDVMDFTLWAEPVPLRWVARIEGASGAGFIDRQVRGPFASWVHRHEFATVDDAATEVIDRVEAELKRHAMWGPIGWLMWSGMPLLFAFRARQTKRLLERKAAGRG